MRSLRRTHFPALAFAVISASLLALRLVAARSVGFGDSEALYASYALFPHPAYLDHPGLVGVLARWIGGGTAPTPEAAHSVTAILATVEPLAMACACRAAGASWARSLCAAVVFALVPEIGIGLFALTPDSLLSLSWTFSIALASWSLRSRAGSVQAYAGFVLSGLLAGIASASKVSGGLLFASLAAFYAAGLAREHTRSTAPWAGLAIGAVIPTPIVAFEWSSGWPMLRHRLVDTQSAAGLSWANVGATLGGQIAYLSPLVVVLAVFAVRAAWRSRHDAVGALLLATFAIPFAPLVALCCWSRVAEPHWIAPSLLALVPAASRDPSPPSRNLVLWSCGISGAIVLAIHAWVLLPGAAERLPAAIDPKLDISSELFGWPEVVRAVREEVIAHREQSTDERDRGDDVAVVGPHWTVCAQLQAALRREVPIGCATPVRDDFDDWYPRPRWRRAASILLVTDARFDLPRIPGTRSSGPPRHIVVRRGHRAIRTFTLMWVARSDPTDAA